MRLDIQILIGKSALYPFSKSMKCSFNFFLFFKMLLYLSFSRTTSDVPNDFDISGSNHPFRYGGRLAYTQPNTPELSAALYRRQVMSSEALLDDRRSTGSMSKHVSFDASSPCSEIYTSAVPANASKSQERLLDGRKTPEPFPDSKRHPHQTAAFSPVLARAILLGIFLFVRECFLLLL